MVEKLADIYNGEVQKKKPRHKYDCHLENTYLSYPRFFSCSVNPGRRTPDAGARQVQPRIEGNSISLWTYGHLVQPKYPQRWLLPEREMTNID